MTRTPLTFRRPQQIPLTLRSLTPISTAVAPRNMASLRRTGFAVFLCEFRFVQRLTVRRPMRSASPALQRLETCGLPRERRRPRPLPAGERERTESDRAEPAPPCWPRSRPPDVLAAGSRTQRRSAACRSFHRDHLPSRGRPLSRGEADPPTPGA